MCADTNSSPTSDVIVIGAGLIGCTIALRLAQRRLKVLVLERGEPGGEASSAAAGMLAPQGETVEPDAFSDFCSASRDLYPDFVAEVEALSGMEVGYRRDGSLLVGISEEECHELEAVYRAQTGLGLPLERLTPDGVRGRLAGLSPEIRCGLFIPGDHWVDNERLTRAVIEACRRLGVNFCTGRPAAAFEVRSSRVEKVVATYGEEPAAKSAFSAGHFVLAAGCWSGHLAETLGIRVPIVPCRGQMLEFEVPEDLPLVVRAGHHYVVPRAGRQIIAGTTAEYTGFEKAVTGEGLRSILEGVSRIAPFVNDLKFRRAWAGLRPDTPDHLPILGPAEIPNLVFATGHFRNGILLAPITAQIVADLVVKGFTSRPIEPYRPSRFRA